VFIVPSAFVLVHGRRGRQRPTGLKHRSAPQLESKSMPAI
jgi:hypothetical protein